MNTFRDIALSEQLLKALEALSFTIPTEIQKKTIPVALSGRDILASAQTGTGKTLAFLVPTIDRLIQNKLEKALIVVPTRELAQQVAQVVKQVCVAGKIDIFSALLIGGESFGRQVRDLTPKARVIVGTPGRIIDHLERGTLKTDAVSVLILDEMDRMFDVGFSEQIAAILKTIANKAQKLLFSATIPRSIATLTEKVLTNPERIFIETEHRLKPVDSVTQEVLHVKDAEKYTILLDQLSKRNDGAVIIFVKTKHGAKRLAQQLSSDNHPALVMHGDLRQQARTKVIADFRNSTKVTIDAPHLKKRNDNFRYPVKRILVATNVAARGLDVNDVNHVINYDLPQNIEEYVHRIGRTGRAGKTGQSISLVSPEDRKIWKLIERFVLNGSTEEMPAETPRNYRENRNRFRGNGGGRSSRSSGFGGGFSRSRSSNSRSRGTGERSSGGDRPSTGFFRNSRG
jgi:ATP-dependent RNA helicase DeaD